MGERNNEFAGLLRLESGNKASSWKDDSRGRGVKMEEQEDVDVISQKHQEYIYKGTVLREHILNIKGRLQTSKRTRKNPSEADSMKEGWGGKGKEQLKKKRHQQHQRETEGEERSLHSEKPSYSEEIRWYRKGPQEIEG